MCAMERKTALPICPRLDVGRRGTASAVGSVALPPSGAPQSDQRVREPKPPAIGGDGGSRDAVPCHLAIRPGAEPHHPNLGKSHGPTFWHLLGGFAHGKRGR